MPKIKKEIRWEDEDTGFDEIETSPAEDQEFKNLLDADSEEFFYNKGSQLTGVISKIPATGDVIIELDKKNSALMSLNEFMLHYQDLKEGDPITAYFTTYNDGAIILEHSLSSTTSTANALEEAFESKRPVKGKIESANKGGFEVKIFGRSAFCPVSQIDNRFVEDQDIFIGKTLEFLITKFSAKDIVLSRRELLKNLEKDALAQLLASWQENPITEGKIVEIKDFGIIIHLNGVNGFCHISEISHQRISHPKDKYNLDEVVKVKILDIDRAADKPKISLSIKQAEQNPWDDVLSLAPEGKTLRGTVTRLADFGAFVEIAPGLEGLIHISEMSWERRVHHPKDIVSPGDTAEVRVLSVDQINQRISLTMKSVEKDPWFDIETKFTKGSTYKAKVLSLKPFGAFLELSNGIHGFLPLKTLQKAFGAKYRKEACPPKKLQVQIVDIDPNNKKILLGTSGYQSEKIEDIEYSDFLKKNEQPERPTPLSSTGGFGDLLKEAIKNK